jgi:hypothetical protein
VKNFRCRWLQELRRVSLESRVLKVGVLRISTEALSVKVEPEPRLRGAFQRSPHCQDCPTIDERSMAEENPTRSALSTSVHLFVLTFLRFPSIFYGFAGVVRLWMEWRRVGW